MVEMVRYDWQVCIYGAATMVRSFTTPSSTSADVWLSYRWRRSIVCLSWSVILRANSSFCSTQLDAARLCSHRSVWYVWYGAEMEPGLNFWPVIRPDQTRSMNVLKISQAEARPIWQLQGRCSQSTWRLCTWDEAAPRAFKHLTPVIRLLLWKE